MMAMVRGAKAASSSAPPSSVMLAMAAAAAVRRKSGRAAVAAYASPGGRRRRGQSKSRAQPDATKNTKNGRPTAGETSTRNPTDDELQKQKEKKKQQLMNVRWKCASGCGACCKLDKGPDFPSPEEIFSEHPQFLQLYKSMIGPDGWCTNYDQSTRTCNIYQERPLFCRVEPEVFDEFLGVPRSRFHREACSACVDTIKMVYGADSTEISNFKRVIREESNKRQESKSQDKLLDA